MLTGFNKPAAATSVSRAARSEYAAARRVPAFFQGFAQCGHLMPVGCREVRL